MNAIFDSIFKTCFPAVALPPNFNLPDGVTDRDVSPEEEPEESPYAPDWADEPREELAE